MTFDTCRDPFEDDEANADAGAATWLRINTACDIQIR
jgi:hypothetical protein